MLFGGRDQLGGISLTLKCCTSRGRSCEWSVERGRVRLWDSLPRRCWCESSSRRSVRDWVSEKERRLSPAAAALWLGQRHKRVG